MKTISLLSLILLTGCATTAYQTTSQADKLIQERGTPAVRTVDASGNQVYIYPNDQGPADIITIGAAGTILARETSTFF